MNPDDADQDTMFSFFFLSWLLVPGPPSPPRLLRRPITASKSPAATLCRLTGDRGADLLLVRGSLPGERVGPSIGELRPRDKMSGACLQRPATVSPSPPPMLGARSLAPLVCGGHFAVGLSADPRGRRTQPPLGCGGFRELVGGCRRPGQGACRRTTEPHIYP